MATFSFDRIVKDYGKYAPYAAIAGGFLLGGPLRSVTSFVVRNGLTHGLIPFAKTAAIAKGIELAQDKAFRATIRDAVARRSPDAALGAFGVKRHSSAASVAKGLATLGLGVLVGGIAAVLFAPAKGTRLRKQVSQRIGGLAEQAKTFVGDRLAESA